MRFAAPDRGPVQALEGVELRVEPGDCVLLLGRSGAGKTTLLEALLGLVPLAGGAVTVRLGGRHCTWSGAQEVPRWVRSGIGMLFQFAERQIFGRTAVEDVLWGLEGKPERGLHALERVGIRGDLRGAPLQRLSRGEKRRVALAGVLAREPAVLLLDEPHVGLDAQARAILWEEVTRYREERGAAVVVATHWPEPFLPTATRVLCLTGGKTAYYGPPAGFRRAAERDDAALAELLPFGDRLLLALETRESPPPGGEAWGTAARRWLRESL